MKKFVFAIMMSSSLLAATQAFSTDYYLEMLQKKEVIFMRKNPDKAAALIESGHPRARAYYNAGVFTKMSKATTYSELKSLNDEVHAAFNEEATEKFLTNNIRRDFYNFKVKLHQYILEEAIQKAEKTYADDDVANVKAQFALLQKYTETLMSFLQAKSKVKVVSKYSIIRNDVTQRLKAIVEAEPDDVVAAKQEQEKALKETSAPKSLAEIRKSLRDKLKSSDVMEVKEVSGREKYRVEQVYAEDPYDDFGNLYLDD